MIITRLEGGLGNQLFQYAAGRRLANKWKTDLKLDLSIVGHPFNPTRHDHYRLKDFNIREIFATPEEVEQIKNFRQGTSIGKERESSPFEILNYPDNVYLHGFWQDEKYFADIAEILLQEFTLKSPLGATAQQWREKILATECAVSLHIRHGDYFSGGNINSFGVLPFAYYKSCVAELKKSFPHLTAFIFSENFNLVKRFLNLDVPIEFVEGCDSDLDEFYLMSLCKHNIIANSSFSWWAAWLNSNPDKKVFFPNPWTATGLIRKGIPENWIRIPVEHGALLDNACPLLSIIVYVKNNLRTLMQLLSSIFSQTLKDYELILIDDGSTDGSEYLCRQISLNKKVTFINSMGGGI